MTPIKGDFATLYLEEYGTSAGFGIVGCTTGDAINFNTELVEVTGVSSNFVEVLPTFQSGNITTDSLLITTVSGDTQIASDVLVGWQKNQQQLGFTYEWMDGVTPYTISGIAYIISLSINAPAQDFANVTIGLQITGEWQLDF